MTDGQGLGIDQIESSAVHWYLHRGRQQGADRSRERLQTCHPLLVRAEARKSRSIIVSHQPVSLLETGHPETPLEQRDGQHFGISKGRLVMGRLPPVRQRGMGGQEIVDKDVEFGQVMLYARHRSRSSADAVMARNLTLICLSEMTLILRTQDWG